MSQPVQQPVSGYRRDKFLSYFKFLDSEKDGYIRKENYDDAVKNMARLSNASVEETESLVEVLIGWWKMYRDGKKDVKDVPIADAVKRSVVYVSTTDPAIAKKCTRLTHERMFDLINQSKDGVIYPKGLQTYYNSYGVHDAHFINDVFKRIDVRGNSVISREQFVEAHLAFWYSDDPESGCHFLFETPK